MGASHILRHSHGTANIMYYGCMKTISCSNADHLASFCGPRFTPQVRRCRVTSQLHSCFWFATASCGFRPDMLRNEKDEVSTMLHATQVNHIRSAGRLASESSLADGCSKLTMPSQKKEMRGAISSVGHSRGW